MKSSRSQEGDSVKRTGDTIRISGDYQYRALTEGNPVKRFWHYNKQLAIKQLMPPAVKDFVIDVGCGSGVVTSFLGDFGSTVLGIDGNPDAIRFAEEKYSRSNVQFRLGLVDDNIKLDSLADKIYCLEVIEHIFRNQAGDMLRTFHKILKPGGRVFLTTPNYRSLWPAIEYLMDKFGVSPPMSEHQHIEFYDRKKLKDLCCETGFTIELMTTTCLIAPWLAPIGWNLAVRVSRKEQKLPFYLGSILICIMTKKV